MNTAVNRATINITRGIISNTPIIDNTTPTHPQLCSLSVGNGSVSSVMISPTIGVNRRLKINAQPKPIRRVRPTRPTSTETKHPEKSPKIISNNDMIYSFKSDEIP